jgi:TetR/AcrR family transcriptional repressor of bet genes
VEAVWRVTVDRGLESVSLRHVAAEAGVSVGLLQHYFHDKDEMLLFALESLTNQVGRRTAQCVAALDGTDEPKALIRAMLIELLPLNPERAAEAHVASAFLTRAAVDPKVSAHLQGGYVRAHGFLTTQLRRGGATHPAEEADILLALVDGLALHTLAGHHLPEGALAALDRLLDGAASGPRAGHVDGRRGGREAVAAAQPVGGGRLG